MGGESQSQKDLESKLKDQEARLEEERKSQLLKASKEKQSRLLHSNYNSFHRNSVTGSYSWIEI